jgi:hypothetical protein
VLDPLDEAPRTIVDLLLILCFEPSHEAREGRRSGTLERAAPSGELRVVLQHFLEDQHAGPAIQQGMVRAPEQPVLLFSRPHHGEPHQRR